jgi:TPP-dependent pyruvate/acetoin dehydrogenase alpha subunit
VDDDIRNEFGLSRDTLLGLYRGMLTVRYFEEKIDYGFSRDEISGTTHLCVGQEAVPVGISANLSDSDYVVSNHRGHGHALSKGLLPEKLMAEIMGKANGYCKGKGGTQHVAFIEKGFLGTNGITGGGIPIAVGAALTIKIRKRGSISVCFFGDGATNQGTFHESLNMASLWKLPILFVCENNSYAMSTPVEKSVCCLPIVRRAEAYGIKGVVGDGMDVIEIAKLSKEIINEIRSGGGPVLFECKTYRFRGHSKSDPRIYRTREEEKVWKVTCPIKKLKNTLVVSGMATAERLAIMEKELKSDIHAAYAKAVKGQSLSITEALEDIWVG